jgi:hypothetical protein
MAVKVFISYRRDDSAGHAGRVHDRLEREFGRGVLFMDVDAIPLGVNFIKVLREEVAKCDVLLALIGPNWLDVRDEEGKRRLDNPTDFLRIEIATALQRDIPVIPILLDRATMPKADQLPKDLEELAVRNGLHVRHASFHSDMNKLVQDFKRLSSRIIPPQSPPQERRKNREAEANRRREEGAKARTSLIERQRLAGEADESRPADEADLRVHEGRILLDAAFVQNTNGKWFLPGAGRAEWFKDHEAATGTSQERRTVGCDDQPAVRRR